MADLPKTYAELFAAAKMTVLWDLEDCPVPDGLTPGVICQNIRTSLLDLGHRGPIAIMAFANDTTEIPVGDFESAGIKVEFISEGPNGKTRSRDYALKVELMYVAFDREASSIMVISAVISDTPLQDMSALGYEIHLVQPRNGPKCQIIRNVTRMWFWESLSVGGKPIEKPATCPSCRSFIGDADALPQGQGEGEEHVCPEYSE